MNKIISENTGESIALCDSVVDAAIALAENDTFDKCKSLGIREYVHEYRTIHLRLPRRTGKTTYILNHATENDLIIHRYGLKNIFVGSKARSYSFSELIRADASHDVFGHVYEKIWLDEINSYNVSTIEYETLIDGLINTGRELVVLLGS